MESALLSSTFPGEKMTLIQSIKNSFGAYVLGTFISSMLLGLAYIQTYHYFNAYSDGLLLKLLVIAVTGFETLHVACFVHAMYYFFVTNHYSPLALLHPIWSIDVQFGLVGIVVLLTQLFYAKRVYIIGRKRLLIPVVIAVLAVTHLIASWILVVVLFRVKSALDIPRLTYTLAKVVLSVSVAMDVTVAATLSYFLHTSRTGFKKTNRLINRLMIYAINNGIIIAIFEIITLTLVIARPLDMTILAFSAVLASLCTNSFLATLNTRKPIESEIVESESDSGDPPIRFGAVVRNDPENATAL